MMSTDSRYALLANGANFSCQVLDQLKAIGFPPNLVVLPEYPPAKQATHKNFDIELSSPHFISQIADIPIEYAPQAKQHSLIEIFQQHAIDFMLIACWPYLIDQSVYQRPIKAALNLHPSLLPEYRGPDPLNRQIAGLETSIGITLHLLNARFDQGDIVDQASFEVSNEELELTLLEQRCAVVGVALYVNAIKTFGTDSWNPIPQH
jgi:methionyl-tRNA formyltransferase